MPVALKQDGTSLRPDPAEDPAAAEAGEDGARTAVSGQAPSMQAVLGALGQMAMLRAAGDLGTREQIQNELDGIAAAIRMFHLKQPDQVMRECGAYGARLTELIVLLHRVESLDRQYTRVRTQQVQTWLSELDRQFKIASRLVEVQRQDIALMGGQT